MIPGQRIEQLRLALMLLTRLPVGRLSEPAPSLGNACWAFPLAGLPVGFIGWAGFSGALICGLTPVLAAFASLAAMVLTTGALHHDGLADFADGIGGGRDRDHCLKIMRDSRIGSYGVAALIFAIGMQVAAISTGSDGIPLITFLFIGLTSRLLMLAVLVSLPPARPDGLGNKASCRKPAVMLPGAIAAILLSFPTGFSAMAIFLTMCLVAGAIAILSYRCIKGQAGDTLGAAQMSAETAGWITWSAIMI